MKKRLLAMLLALMLVVGLLPVGVLAADEASQQSENGYFTISYQNEGLYARTINVTLLLNGTVLDTVTVSDAIWGSQRVTVSLNATYNSQYDIENVDISGCDAVAPSLLADSYSAQVSNISENTPANIYIHLIEYEAPEVDEEINGQGVTRTYRIYDDQIYKILHFEGVEVSAETEIVSVTPLWVRQFGTESNKELIKENRETDYWDNSFTSDSSDVVEVQPGNIKEISIEYNNGSGVETVTVSSGDLRVLTGGISGSKYYVIELNDDSFHIVYFYNEPGAQVINNYELYDVRFVEHNGNLVGNMPADPTYPASSYYEFVAWTSDYNAGRPFLETTTVSEDITVYAQKRTTTSNNSWIYVMNDNNLLKKRITELYNEADVAWDSVKITVYGKDDEHTNPDYNLGQYNGNGWRDDDEYYHVYNYLSGVGDQQNESIAINNISKIVITANDTSGIDLGSVTIEKGIYDGDFWVSAGNTAAQHIAYIYINDNGVEDPDEGGEEPGPEPEPEEPSDPTDTELRELAVVLECTNGEVEHAEKTKTFHMRTTNCDLEIQQFGEEYICTVAPDYEKILSTYNTATEATHEYEDGGKQFTLIWSANTKAWEVAGDASITRQVKCETPEPELETVRVFAEVNGVMEEKPIWTGSAEHGTSTVDYLNSNKTSMPLTRDGYELEDGWFNHDHPGQQLNAETTINGWTNVYVKFTGKPQTVQVMIYRNGDTTKPYATIDVPGYKTGDTIYTEDFDIDDYYTKDKFATYFVFDGWFDDGRWNNYKDAGCPEEDFTTVDEIYVNGWKNVIAMVWDVYPVNYHVLDKDGNEIDNKTDYITERDLAGYELWDYSKAGHTFDGWYENDKDIGNDNKKEPVPLAPLKKYELYGLCDPIPQHLEIYAAIDKNKEEAVKIYSDMVDYGTPLVAYLETLELETDIFPGYSPEDGKWYKYDSPKWTFGENDTVSGWTNVLINYVPNEYTIYYHGNGGLYKGEHDQVSSPFKYDSTATIKNNVFEKAGYVFIGWALSAEGGVEDVVYTGGEDVTFNTETFPGLLANGKVDLYAVWAEDKLGGGEDGESPDGVADYRQVFVKYVAADGNGFVTPSFDTFNLEVDENGKVMTNVALSLKGEATPNTDATFAYWTIDGLGYDGGAYSYEADLSGKDFTGYVAGETYTFTAYFNGPVVKPEQPDVYKIYVTVHNGTATFCGSEVTSHILAAENEDITITFTPDEGYTLDYATIDGNMLLIPDDGVYTLKLVDSDHTIEVFYAVDKLGGGDNGNEPDGTPDYRQVFVKYVAADGNGFVTPSFDTFNLEVDENGKVMTNVALSLKGEATPNTDATFAYWTIDGLGYDGGAYSYEADLSGKDFTGYVAGETYTFTAYFNGPVVKPEQVPYNINVEVVNGTAEFKGTNIGANSVINVYPIEDDNKNVTITFVPEDGFVFDAAYVGNEPVDLKDNSYTFGEVTADVTIKVLFKQDSVPITPVTPMPTPGEISDLIKDSITVDCVNGEVAHADKVYGLLAGSLVNVEKTDDTSIKVTLDATVYQARYNTDTETKHSLADGQSATVTFALNYVDQRWRVAGGELPITIKVVCETPVESDPDITDFSKTLVKDRNLYVYQGLAYPTFYRGSVIVDEGDGVTLLYKITVKGTPGTEFTVRDDSADFVQTGEIPDSGETSFYVAKTFTWREIRRADELTNTAAVLLDGEVADSDTETVDVDIDWDYNPPVVDDDDDDDEDVSDDATPNWLNLDDHDAYIQGYPDGCVKPQNNITRAEVATIFYRLLTDDARDYYYSTDSGFSDVNPGDWYNTAVATMVQAGILNGYSDGTFKPNASITRAEFATIAARFLSNPYSTKDRFYDTEGHWAEVYINRAAEIGWIGGYPDGSFKPDQYITRAEAVTLVNNVLGREPHADYMLDDMIRWPDNPKSAWYYEDIQEATNSHDYRWNSGKSYEIWTKLLETR